MTDVEPPRRSARNAARVVAPATPADKAAPAGPKASGSTAEVGKAAASKKRAKDVEKKEEEEVKVRGNGKAEQKDEESAPKKSKSTSTKLAVGDHLPSLTLKDDEDGDVDVSTLKNVVFFIYPKADTPGCTTQACNFRDGYQDFEDVGFKVYGLSADTVTAQHKWSSKHTFGYPLLSDRSKELLTAFGCIQAGKIVRSHVVVGKEGKVEVLSNGVKPANSKVDCLEAVKKLVA